MADAEDLTSTPESKTNESPNGGIGSAPLLLIVAFLVGIGTVVAPQDMVRKTQDNPYCTESCHSMGRVGREYAASVHGLNGRGLQATCAECHIPHEYPEVLFYKAKNGLRDVVQEMRGVITTDEQFEEERLRLAQAVWKEYRSNDSAACRQCHVFSAEVIEKQKPAAQQAHNKIDRPEATCIDCHRGVAHVAPLE
jgi:nitrate/TMAO reductase-like tetraheme cytochrome c subunit